MEIIKNKSYFVFTRPARTSQNIGYSAIHISNLSCLFWKNHNHFLHIHNKNNIFGNILLYVSLRNYLSAHKKNTKTI